MCKDQGEWLATMHEELEALKAKKVYKEAEQLLPGHKAIQSKWVLHIKQNKEGLISHFKVQLVAKGFTYVFRQDFTFTFTSITCWESIHSILYITTLNDFKLRHLNVKNVYLNIPLQEEIYMVASKGLQLHYWQL
jgi:reverse transcriptase-like protein